MAVAFGLFLVNLLLRVDGASGDGVDARGHIRNIDARTLDVAAGIERAVDLGQPGRGGGGDVGAGDLEAFLGDAQGGVVLQSDGDALLQGQGLRRTLLGKGAACAEQDEKNQRGELVHERYSRWNRFVRAYEKRPPMAADPRYQSTSSPATTGHTFFTFRPATTAMPMQSTAIYQRLKKSVFIRNL